MLHSGCWSPDDNGEYFIDRSPQAFPHVLEYLRSHKKASLSSSSEPSSENEVELLERDLDFYQVTSYNQPTQVQWCCPQPVCVALKNNCATLSRDAPSSAGTWYIGAFLQEPDSSGCSYWRVVGSATSMGAQWNGNIGLGVIRGHRARCRVAIGWNSGNIYEAGQPDGHQGVQWEGRLDRMVDFCFNRKEEQLSMYAMGTCITCKIPTEHITDMVPVAFWFAVGSAVDLHLKEVPLDSPLRAQG
eukprot:TRINITY_DN68074_c5_g2_i2.p1 TRINITY_DN68074_c5_g2~~TRINITY_DN68074_c5_g2_i2.p1  ORF type:complete len:244 (+),score=21.19 TRINITY_DN68074_c5_g2_i2:310-1041(+)